MFYARYYVWEYIRWIETQKNMTIKLCGDYIRDAEEEHNGFKLKLLTLFFLFILMTKSNYRWTGFEDI